MVKNDLDLHKLHYFSAYTMFQVYGCNKFHRIIGPVNAYLRSSSHFSHVKYYVSKIDLAVKKVKVILGSSFEQTMMVWRPKSCITSSVKIGLPVPEKKIFEWFLPYMGVAAILVM